MTEKGKEVDDKLQRHEGALSILEEDLKDIWPNSIFERNCTLNKLPLEIDMVVSMVDASIGIENEIGRIFRKYNIVEYKSERDKLDIKTLMKVEAYACLYLVNGNEPGNQLFNEITMTIIRESKPLGLFEFLKDNGFRVEEKYDGIYYVEGALSFPAQIIVGRELNLERHRWFEMASGNVSEETMREALEYTNSVTNERERALLESIMDMSMRENSGLVEKIKESGNMITMLREMFAPELEEAERKTAQRVERETAQRVERETAQRVERETAQRVERETAQRVERETRESQIKLAVKSLRHFNVSDDDIKATLTEDYGLSEEEALSYLS